MKFLWLFLVSIANLVAQKPYSSSFTDSLSHQTIYNPFKIDTIINDANLLRVGWYKDIIAFEKKGEFEKALKILNTKDKDSFGMYLLGKYNYFGLGTSKKKEIAFAWYQKSSGLGFAPSSENLSVMYFLGETKVANDSIALILLKKAFNSGAQTAATKIGFIFHNGGIIKKNLDSASFWYKKAININNDKYALYNNSTIDESRNNIENAIAGYRKAAELNVELSSQRLGEIYYKGIGLKPDIDNAKIWFIKGCEQNNAQSCNFLGLIYINQKDSTKAFQYFKKGYLLKDPISTYNLAICLSEGIGSIIDISQSYTLYNSIASNNSNAQNNIGTLYERNLIGKNDFHEALVWYEKSAKNNNISAMLNAGKLAESGGFNLKIDLAKAKFWYQEAAKQGNKNGIFLLSRLLRHTNIIKAIEWSEKIANTGDLDAMRLAGDLNRQRADLIIISNDKKGTIENRIKESTKIVLYNKAIKWYEKASQSGDDSSMVRLGQLYYAGKFVKKDHALAKKWWGKAAVKGNATAYYNLAYLYEKGLDNKVENINYKSAAEYYKEVIEIKNVKSDLKRDAAYKLGTLYQYADIKKGLEKDNKEAIKWYKIAANLNDKEAMFEIGVIYETGGANILINKEEAIKWYKKAANLGQNDAQIALNRIEK